MCAWHTLNSWKMLPIAITFKHKFMQFLKARAPQVSFSLLQTLQTLHLDNAYHPLVQISLLQGKPSLTSQTSLGALLWAHIAPFSLPFIILILFMCLFACLNLICEGVFLFCSPLYLLSLAYNIRHNDKNNISSSQNLLGQGNGNPLQYSYLDNPMDGGAWQAAVHGVAKSQTRLSIFTFTFHFHALEKELATHSSVLAWRILGTGEPGGCQSMGSQSRTLLR